MGWGMAIREKGDVIVVMDVHQWDETFDPKLDEVSPPFWSNLKLCDRLAH